MYVPFQRVFLIREMTKQCPEVLQERLWSLRDDGVVSPGVASCFSGRLAGHGVQMYQRKKSHDVGDKALHEAREFRTLRGGARSDTAASLVGGVLSAGNHAYTQNAMFCFSERARYPME